MAREIGYLISRVNLLSNRLLNRLLIDAQVTAFNSEQGKLLYVLWQEDGITVSALAEETNLALNTVSRMLLTMEASGLVTRVPDADDRRIKRVFLTEKGRAAQHDAVSGQRDPGAEPHHHRSVQPAPQDHPQQSRQSVQCGSADRAGHRPGHACRKYFRGAVLPDGQLAV